MAWGLWLQWALASAAGCALTLAVALAVQGARSGPHPVYQTVSWAVTAPILLRMPTAPSLPLYRVLSWVLAGASVGSVQWLVLRHRIGRAGWWIPASTIGWTAGGFLASQVPIAAAQSVVIAVSLGIAQWLLLRRRASRAGWWIIASTLSWTAGATVGDALLAMVGLTLALLLVGALSGIVSGGVLVRLLARRGSS